MTSFYNQRWEKPFLTPSIAVELLTKTPYHARLKCPYYQAVEKKSSGAMDEGSIVDGLVLGRGPEVTVIYAEAYTTQQAKSLRDGAKEHGRIPVKVADWRRIRATADSLWQKIANQSPSAYNAIQGGKIKERLFWESDGVYLSTEPDVHYLDAVLDLKRTKVAPTEQNWRRHASSMRYDIQCAAALEATGAKRFGWLIVEADPPHCVVCHYASDAFIKVGARDWRHAKQVWANCVASNVFPAYESAEIDPSPWLLGDDEDITFTEGEE